MIAARPGNSVAAQLRRQSATVLVSGACLGLGGIRTHLVLLCNLLCRSGVDVLLFATASQWDRATLEEMRRRGVKLFLPPAALQATQRLAACYSALSWPLRVPSKAASLYCIGAGRSHHLLNRLKPKGTVSVNHEIVVPPDRESPAGRCASRLDVSVANSLLVAEIMRSFWANKPIRVIPFLTSDGPVTPPKRNQRRAGPLRVLYLGRLVEQKRPDQLVRRWRELTRHPALAGATLDLFGYSPGKMLIEIRQFVAETGLTNLVRIHGGYSTADLPRILLQADLVVLPSLWEGLPLVLVEAMLHGVPFVATAAGGTEELGIGNPDVCVTGLEWTDFEEGLIGMGIRIQAGRIDPGRLCSWAEARYGYEAVTEKWLHCLLRPQAFFNLHD